MDVAHGVLDKLVDAGNRLTPFDGIAGPGPGEKRKWVDDYVFIFRVKRETIEILGVFHAKEDWQSRMARRR